jgi:spoIIIJ-associated protein
MEEDYTEFEAKSVDEAIIHAMKSFKADFEDLEIKVISEGSKGLFGLVGTKTAKILARKIASAETKSEVLPQEPVKSTEPQQTTDTQSHKEVQAPTEEQLTEAREILKKLLALMNMPSSEINISQESILEIIGDGSGLIIGKRGQTLDALQFILNRIVNKPKQQAVYITLDTEGYRQKHLNYLRSMALKMGQRARRTGQAVSLEEMNPYDRRIIHLALKNEAGLNTKSVGEGIYKKVVILPRKASRR